MRPTGLLAQSGSSDGLLPLAAALVFLVPVVLAQPVLWYNGRRVLYAIVSVAVGCGLFLYGVLVGPTPWITLLYPVGVLGVQFVYGKLGVGQSSDDPLAGRPGRAADREADTGAATANGQKELTPDRETLLEGTPERTFADVGGMDGVVEILQSQVIDPLEQPEQYEDYGLGVTNGILLHGPPGCGKTYLARALAGETDHAFLEITPTDITSRYVGQAADNVASVFETARDNQPCLLFIDEIDAIASDRSNDMKTSEQQMVNQLLAELDDLDGTDVVVIAATNYVEDVDDAILRSGRFDERVEIPPPDPAAREEILDVHLREPPTAPGIDVEPIVSATGGYAASDIELVAELAARHAMIDDEPVDAGHLQRAVDETTTSIPEWLDRYEQIDATASTTRTGLPPAIEGIGDDGGFDELPGMSGPKDALRERVLHPIANAAEYESFGVSAVDGALLYGPAGCGKSRLARAFAAELDAGGYQLTPETLLDAKIDDPAGAIDEAVAYVTEQTPCVLLVDELCTIAPASGGGSNRTAMAIASALEQVADADVIVLGTARTPNSVDDDVVHAGCFDERIEVGQPDAETRRAVLEATLPPDVTARKLDWARAVAATDGLTTRELRHVAQAAARDALRDSSRVDANRIVAASDGQATPSAD
jgi:SpoVK/Ycf46/Vps4 family AAA+-type ATPase